MRPNRSVLYIFAIITILYVVGIMIILYFVTSLPSLVNNLQSGYKNEMKSSLVKILEEDKNLIKQLTLLEEKEQIEFFVLDKNKDEVVYATLPTENIETFYGTLNKNAISNEEGFTVNVNETEYYIWYATYNISPQKILNNYVFTLVIVFLVIISLIFIINLIVLRNSIRPLKRLQENIYKLSHFQLKQIQDNKSISDFDALSYELVVFANDLSNKINKVDTTYTSLERELQMQQEVMEYNQKMLASLAHDLKVPIHIIRLKLEKILKQEITTYETNDLLNESYKKLENLTLQINDIVKISHADNIDILNSKETFDLSELLLDLNAQYTELFNKRNFNVDVEVDLDVLVHANKIQFKQIIHNALSNIYYYALDNADVNISCYVENDEVLLSFYNDATYLEEDQLKNIFTLFYRISENSEGLGTGLHTMKSIALENNGSVNMINIDNGVQLTFIFAKKVSNND